MSITKLKEAKKAKPDYLDFDGDQNTKESMRKALKDKAKQKVEEAKKVKLKRWWDDDGDGIGWESGEVSGKFKKKKKVVKEEYSNWREDLSEVISLVNKDKNENKITGKGVNNKSKIKINPSISEAVENLGGTLLEFVETENICILEDLKKLEILTLDDELLEEVVYEFFIESLEEGYTVDEIEFCILESIENSLSYLTEEEDSKKRGVLSRIKRFVKGAAKKLARGAGYVAGVGVRAAKGTAREVASGYKKGRLGAEEKSEPDSSSSETSSTETKVRDSAKDGVRKGFRRTLSNLAAYASKKLDPDRGKPSAAHTKGPRTQKLRSGIGGGKKYEVAGRKKEIEPKTQQKPSEVHSREGVRKPKPYSTSVRTAKVKTAPRMSGSSGESTSEAKPSTPPSTPKRTRKPRTQTKTTKVTTPKTSKNSSKVSSKKNSDPTEGKLDDLLKSIRSEEYQLDEKTLTSNETKKREKIVRSMKDKLSDFEKRYPGRGKEVMYATATKMAKKITEQTQEIQTNKPEKPQQEQKPQTSKISSALTAIEKESQAEMQKSRALRRLAQSGGDISSVTK